LTKLNFKKQHWLPDLNLDYFRGSIRVIAIIKRLSIGNCCSDFFSGNISKTKVAQLELQSWEQQKQNEEQK
jgi:cobalt-zinc-cadmium resistance protein CzcA